MAKVIKSGDGAALNLQGRASTEVVSGAIGATSTFRIVEIAPETMGMERGPHLHDGFEEVIYVASGEGVMRADSGQVALRSGDTVLVPPGERHATRNIGATPLRLLCFFPVPDIRPGTHEFPDWSDLADD